MPETCGESNNMKSLRCCDSWTPFRQLRYWRLKAVKLILEHLARCEKELAINERVMATRAVAVHILHSVVTPAAPTRKWSNVLERFAYQLAPDAVNAAEALLVDMANLLEPGEKYQGLYFVPDVIRHSRFQGRRGFFRIASRNEFTLASQLILFNQPDSVSLYQHFNVAAIRNIPNLAFQHPTRLTRPKQTSIAQFINRLPPEPEKTFGLQHYHIQILEPAQLVGEDIPPVVEDRVDYILESGNIITICNLLIHQLAYDLMARSPNQSSGPAYTTLTPIQIDSVTPTLFQGNELPFRGVQITAVPLDVWYNIIEHLLPDQGHAPKAGASGYPAATYMHAWITLMNRLGNRPAMIVRQAVMKELRSWLWLPMANARAMWVTTGGYQFRGLILPKGYNGMRVVIAANPTIIHSEGQLKRFYVHV